MISELFKDAVIAWCANQIPDTLQIVFCGILKGLGKQKSASISSFIISFGVMLPLSYLFGNILGFGLSGLFVGLLFGNTALSTFYCLLIVLTDWRLIILKVSQEARRTNN